MNEKLIYLLSTNIKVQDYEEYLYQPTVDDEGEIISNQDWLEKNRY
jgi:hypothetical protein